MKNMLDHDTGLGDEIGDCSHLFADAVPGNMAHDRWVSPGPGRILKTRLNHCAVMAFAAELKNTRRHGRVSHRLCTPEAYTSLS